MNQIDRRGFVRAEGKQLVDDDGVVHLRGVGLGNWLLPEGYMWRFGDHMASPRQIEFRIERAVGYKEAARFWERFDHTFITERDFALIAEMGFDHVRLPFLARNFIDPDGQPISRGFALMDQAVQWSKDNGLRILLDLHGAPGGQTGTNIDDSANMQPELFMFRYYQELTFKLWREIARKYRDDPAILGYDLLNEPIPLRWQYQYEEELMRFYRELTDEIRGVDQNHLLVYEGSGWATNPSPLRVRFDDNQMVEFHRYWCPPDTTSIREFLDLRDELECPIYMGEGGENTPAWVYAMTGLYERHGIGWNFWPWKKLDTSTSPLSARMPAHWDEIADPTVDPSPARAAQALSQYLENSQVDNCDVRTEVVDALMLQAPLSVPAWAGLKNGQERTIADLAGGEVPQKLWDHADGRVYDADELIPVKLERGETLVFPLREAPVSWEVKAEPNGAVSSHWDGQAVVFQALSSASIISARFLN